MLIASEYFSSFWYGISCKTNFIYCYDHCLMKTLSKCRIYKQIMSIIMCCYMESGSFFTINKYLLVPWYREAGTLQIGAVILKLP